MRINSLQEKSEKTGTILGSWQRIEAWLDINAKSVARSLRQGAKPQKIKELEDRLGVILPNDFKESCLLHDGQKDEADLIPDGYGTFYLLPLSQIPQEWKMMNDLARRGEFRDFRSSPDQGVADGWWNSGWIPFASNGGGDYYCIDLAPTISKLVGQVIKILHDQGHRKVLAPSYHLWLQQLADALEHGDLFDFLEFLE